MVFSCCRGAVYWIQDISLVELCRVVMVPVLCQLLLISVSLCPTVSVSHSVSAFHSVSVFVSASHSVTASHSVSVFVSHSVSPEFVLTHSVSVSVAQHSALTIRNTWYSPFCIQHSPAVVVAWHQLAPSYPHGPHLQVRSCIPVC